MQVMIYHFRNLKYFNEQMSGPHGSQYRSRLNFRKSVPRVRERGEYVQTQTHDSTQHRFRRRKTFVIHGF
jgi:hypothetical protein